MKSCKSSETRFAKVSRPSEPSSSGKRPFKIWQKQFFVRVQRRKFFVKNWFDQNKMMWKLPPQPEKSYKKQTKNQRPPALAWPEHDRSVIMLALAWPIPVMLSIWQYGSCAEPCCSDSRRSSFRCCWANSLRFSSHVYRNPGLRTQAWKNKKAFLFCQNVSIMFSNIFDFGWGTLPPRPPGFWLGGRQRHPRLPP